MSNDRFQAKNFFRLNGGLNTEINELNFQDGFTKDEANYELLVDGSRRRRKGLAAESGAGAAKTIDTLGAGYQNQCYLWENVGGNPDKRVMVYRTGDLIYFADADATISDGWYSGASKFISMDAARSDDATDALVRKGTVSFTQGRGHLFITGQYILPFYVKYDATADTFASYLISVLIRDYSTIDDGTSVEYEPTDATIPADHKVNIRNRGWSNADMVAYESTQSKWPARNAIWHKGYKRVKDESSPTAVEQDGTMAWDASKLDAEAFGLSSAPVGSLFLNVHDTTQAYIKGSGAGGGSFDITTWTKTGTTTWTVTLTTDAAHGLVPTDEFVISGLTFDYYMDEGGDLVPFYNYAGFNWDTHTADTGTTGSTIVFDITAPPVFDSFINQYKTLGSVDTAAAASIPRSTGTDHGDSFKAVEFHAGRVFYGGMLNTEFNDMIMFSQISESDEKFGHCYQAADPTDPNFNAMVPTDGGYMVIPGMGGVQQLVSVRNSLLVLATQGIWEISGGQRGLFTSDGYSVRKLSDSGCISPDGYANVEGSLIYAGVGGLFIVAPNQYTGQLEVTNFSEQTIQSLWNQIPDEEQKRVQMIYDNSTKRLWVMHGPNGTKIGINTMLIYDSRAQAWFKYTFNSDATDSPVDLTNNVLLTGFALPNLDDTTDNKKLKFIYEVSTTSVQVADFDQTGYDDWDGTNGPLPYLTFGDDNIGDWQSRRQAPVITVHSKRTETGYTSTGNGWEPVNESSTLMTAFWDWTDEKQWTDINRTAQEPWDGTVYTTSPSVSGKVGRQQQVYRHVRPYVPVATGDVDGYPVVVTRNKVRGRGRSLRLRFDGATDKDSHLLGYQVNYKVPQRHNV